MSSSRLAHRIAAAEVYLLLLIWPALLFPTPGRMTVALVIPAVWLCARLTTGHWVPPTLLNGPLWIILCMVAVSMMVTPDRLNSLGKVAGLVYGVALFWALVRWVGNARRLRLLVLAHACAGGCLALVGLFGTDWIPKFQQVDAVVALLPRLIRGVPGAESGFNPNAVAGCLVLFVPVQAAVVWSNLRGSSAEAAWWPRGRLALVFQCALLLLTTGTLVLTQSRNAWAAVAVAFGAFLVRRSTVMSRTLVGIGVAGAIVVTLIVPARVWTMLEPYGGPRIAYNVESRLELWNLAADAISRAPLTGLGMNTFRKVTPPPEVFRRERRDIAHAHNHLLQVALDLGLPGLLAYVAIWFGAARLLGQPLRRARDSVARAVASGLWIGLLAHFCFGMVDAIPLGAKVGVVFWLTLAMAVALQARWRAGDFS